MRAAELYRRARHRLGRRGAVLLFLAGLDLVFAASLATAEAATAEAYAFLSHVMPLWVWAIPWAAVGLVCLAYSTADHDRPAYAAASGLKVGWGVIYLAGWICGELPRGYAPAAIWLGCAAVVQVIAGWPEPRQAPR